VVRRLIVLTRNLLLAGWIVVCFSLSGCLNSGENVQSEEFKGDSEGFMEPDSSDWVEFIKPVREYLYYRTGAVLKNDIQILWDQYPKLKENIDVDKGINVEKMEVDSLNESFKLVDANFTEERNDRIKLKEIGEREVVVLVHGGISYIRDDFEETGGEILIKLYLEKVGNHWIIVKTDEYTLPEYKEWIKRET
jgi:hypothetical protein